MCEWEQRLRKAIIDDDRSLPVLARLSGVSYNVLVKFVRMDDRSMRLKNFRPLAKLVGMDLASDDLRTGTVAPKGVGGGDDGQHGTGDLPGTK